MGLIIILIVTISGRVTPRKVSDPGAQLVHVNVAVFVADAPATALWLLRLLLAFVVDLAVGARTHPR